MMLFVIFFKNVFLQVAELPVNCTGKLRLQWSKMSPLDTFNNENKFSVSVEFPLCSQSHFILISEKEILISSLRLSLWTQLGYPAPFTFSIRSPVFGRCYAISRGDQSTSSKVSHISTINH